MTSSVHVRDNQGLSKHRIEALSDGIFAFAMTVLILDIKIPKISGVAPGELRHELFGLAPKILSFVVSFVMLGLFWIAHHGYAHFVKRTDRYYLWLNLLFLMVVVLVPFSTDLWGDYPHERLAAMIYGGNIMALGVTLYWQWAYATNSHRLVGKNIEPVLVRYGKKRILMGISANICAILLAFFNPAFSLVIFSLFPVVYMLPSRLDQHWMHSHG